MYSMLSTLQEACNKYVDLYVVNVHSRYHTSSALVLVGTSMAVTVNSR